MSSSPEHLGYQRQGAHRQHRVTFMNVPKHCSRVMNQFPMLLMTCHFEHKHFPKKLSHTTTSFESCELTAAIVTFRSSGVSLRWLGARMAPVLRPESAPLAAPEQRTIFPRRAKRPRSRERSLQIGRAEPFQAYQIPVGPRAKPFLPLRELQHLLQAFCQYSTTLPSL
jgi:hypothetical protein